MKKKKTNQVAAKVLLLGTLLLVFALISGVIILAANCSTHLNNNIPKPGPLIPPTVVATAQIIPVTCRPQPIVPMPAPPPTTPTPKPSKTS